MGHCLGSPVAVAPEKERASLNTEFLEERHEIENLDPEMEAPSITIACSNCSMQ